jgi:hypothetical protein
LACLAEAEPEPPAPWRVGSSGKARDARAGAAADRKMGA